MQSTHFRTSWAFKIALVNLTLGSLGVIYSFFSNSYSTGLRECSFGLLLLGIGEYINNPQVNDTTNKAENQSNVVVYFSRRRNVCALGNLLDIAGILMIAIGAASLLF